jgi:hypothetical protein
VRRRGLLGQSWDVAVCVELSDVLAVLLLETFADQSLGVEVCWLARKYPAESGDDTQGAAIGREKHAQLEQLAQVI